MLNEEELWFCTVRPIGEWCFEVFLRTFNRENIQKFHKIQAIFISCSTDTTKFQFRTSCDAFDRIRVRISPFHVKISWHVLIAILRPDRYQILAQVLTQWRRENPSACGSHKVQWRGPRHFLWIFRMKFQSYQNRQLKTLLIFTSRDAISERSCFELVSRWIMNSPWCFSLESGKFLVNWHRFQVVCEASKRTWRMLESSQVSDNLKSRFKSPRNE